MHEEIRAIIEGQARLPGGAERLSEETNLYEAGMTSHASVNVLLALEDHFDVEFPDDMLKRSVFESIGAIAEAIAELRKHAAV